jgi:death on curing protein
MNSAEPWEHLISLETIIELHGEDIARYGGAASDPKPGCVEGSAGGAFNAGLYNAKSDPPSDAEIALVFAGYLLFYLAKNHCFVDGNKRIAWSACMHVLATLGLTLSASEEDAVLYVDAVVNDRVDNGADVVIWLEENLAAIQ